MVLNRIRQWYYIKNLRKKISVGEGCVISRDFKYGSNIKIKNNVRIGEQTFFGNGITIGQYASINKIKIGNNSQIEAGVKITGSGEGKITIGKESYIGLNNILDWSDNITIGDHVHIAGPSTALWTHSSAKQALAGLPLDDKNPKYRPTAPIIIESNVYIGGNCTIYPGIKIGSHAIIAPNSAVDKNVEPNTLVGGVPAKYIKKTT